MDFSSTQLRRCCLLTVVVAAAAAAAAAAAGGLEMFLSSFLLPLFFLRFKKKG